MKTQQEVNNFFQENTVHVSAIYQIVQYLKDLNLKLPNNVILHEKGIGQTDFFKWFEDGPFKPGDVLVSQSGNLVLFSHLERDVVYYHCILGVSKLFSIGLDCGVGKSKDCYLASDVQKQRLLDSLKNAGYEFDTKTNSLKKIAKYPKTYEGCCEKLGIEEDLWFVYEDIDGNHINSACISNYRIRGLELYHNLEKLKICRDAYWKIAGEKIGLDESWEPNWHDSLNKFCIFSKNNIIMTGSFQSHNHILAFPTQEMRDAFYENFKDLIEECKKLL